MALALVTGGAGLIGSHLVEGLLQLGWQVRVFDNLSTGRRENLEGLDAQLVVGDIRDREQVGRAMEGVEWVFHEAALVSVPGSLDDPVACYQINLQGSLNVLWAAHQAQVRRVVLASSAAVYGQASQPVEEGAPKQPLSPYAASKLAMEQAAQLFSEVFGLATVCLRYFNVYGPRQRPDSMYAAVIPGFIKALLDDQPPTIFGDGEQRRDFVYVGDVVRANLLAAESTAAAGGVFNIGGGGSISIRELAGFLQRYFPESAEPTHAPPRGGDIHFSEAVIERAEALGYQPQVDIRDGLMTTVEWFRHQWQTAPA